MNRLEEFLKELSELTEKYGIDRCPLVNERGCLIISDKNVLDLINQQQERIEELELITGLAKNRKYYKKFVDEIFCKQEGKELSEPDFDYIYQLYFEQQAKIERLVAECGNQSTLWRQNFESIFETAKETIKSEAIKEFAERLKKEAVTKCDWDNCVDVEDIDRLVAEMVGE